MAYLIKPGMLFEAVCLPYPGEGGLESTMSNYGIYNLEGSPRAKTTYVVCKDGSIQNHYDRSSPIGWELIEKDNAWFYRVTQMNHKPKPLQVFYKGTTDDIPEGRGFIGSMVFAARKIDEPQKAEITEQDDTDIEVISKHNPGLAAAAAYLDDPVQTAAMAKFVQGKMRGLCG